MIVAAGRGARFGQPKQLLDLAGTPMLGWSVRTFAAMAEVAAIVAVTEEEWIDEVRSLVTSLCEGKDAMVVQGGATRQQSVLAGLNALPPVCDGVLVHDGARPLVHAADVRAAMSFVRDGIGSLLAVPVVDTIKFAASDGRTVERTLERERLWAAQTPQLATARDMRRAHEQALRAGFEATDDAMLLEAAGIEVQIVPGSSENFKVTLPEDMARAKALLRAKETTR